MGIPRFIGRKNTHFFLAHQIEIKIIYHMQAPNFASQDKGVVLPMNSSYPNYRKANATLRRRYDNCLFHLLALTFAIYSISCFDIKHNTDYI